MAEELANAGIQLVNMDAESMVSSKEGRDDQLGLEDNIVIKSMYLQRQDTDPDAEKYREYLENKETFNATRRRQLFKQKEAYEDGKQKLDYSRYKKRTCVVGVPSVKDPQKCGCCRDINHNQHKEFRMEEEDIGTWDFREHTELEDTDAYGRVSFGTNMKAKYVRVDCETEGRELFELLTSVFNLPTPGVVLSVIGSLMGFTCSSKIEKIIQRGMIKAAITTNGWITTTGVDCGHVMTVGDALKTSNGAVPCIGFPSWGCLPDEVQEALLIKPNQFKRGENQCKYPRLKIEPGSARENLEGNHSHFIFADQGGLSDWGTESYMRARVEAYLKDTANIPVVQVVLQGGIGVARQLYLALEAGTPAVIVYGSGGVCDVLVDLIRHEDGLLQSSDSKVHKFSAKLKKQRSRRTSTVASFEGPLCSCNTQQGISLTCPVVKQSMTDSGLTDQAKNDPSFQRRIKEIVTEYRDLLILFDMADSHYDGLDTALLEALVKAQVENTTDNSTAAGNQMSGIQVALGWNRPDFAEKLLNADNAAKDEKAMGSLLVHAMAWNLFEFTELLLSHGASIPMVAANMVVLYGSSQRVDHLKRYVRYNLGERGEIKLNDKTTIDDMINKLIGKKYNFDSNVSNENDPFFELMVWAALSLYPEIAETMWKQTQEPIKGALFVVMILRKLLKAKKTIVNNNEKDTLEFMKDRFEKLAIKILDGLNETCEMALRDKALNSGWERLNNMSYIDMAYSCKAKDFIAHPACQELQDKRWKRGVTSEVGLFTVMLVTICPLILLTPLVSFRKDWVHKNSNNSCFRKFARKGKAFCVSPSVKFWFGVEFYLVFLIYQTYVILFKIDRVDKSFLESETCHQICSWKIILFVWFGLLLVDELLQGISLGNFWDWYDVFWNKLDALMYTFNLCGLILVNIPAEEDAATCFLEGPYNIGRILLSVSSTLFFLRLLHMFTCDKALGPTLLMIQKMMGDFKVFIILFCIIAVAFGVGYAVVLTDPSDFFDDSWGSLSGMLFYPLFQMYGELYVDDLSNEDGAPRFASRTNSTTPQDSGRVGFVVGLVAVYMAFVVLMLVNILIAMFSDTYSKVKEREDVIFKFQRLELLMEMEDSYLPPPFSIVHFTLGYIIDRKAERKYQNNSEAYEQENKWFDSVIRSAIFDSLEEYLKKERSDKGSEMESMMKQNTKKIKQKIFKLQRYMDNIQASMDSNFAELKSFINTE